METKNKNNAAGDGQTILELYKLHVEMADRVSHRRGVTNNWFITMHTSIISGIVFAMGHFEQYKIPLLMVMALGILLAVTWRALIISYKKLNSAKFKVINKIEKDYLPVHPYVDEYEYYQQDGRKDFSTIEQNIPLGLIGIYATAMGIIAFMWYVY